MTTGLRIAALVKQVPQFEEMELGPDGRLVRNGLDAEMNPYCRRAVATGVALAKESDGRCTVFTLGPPTAEDVLREAIAWGADDGVLISDPAFAGSDTLATARALAAAIRREGPFDVVLVGRNSVDSDTGQVGPQIAELLGMAFLGGARTLDVNDGLVHARLEHDDGWLVVETELPAVISCAERLCEPCKMDHPARAAVPAQHIRRLHADDLGQGPWGEAGSPTRVGEVRVHVQSRDRLTLDGPLTDQVNRAAELLWARGVLRGDEGHIDAAAGRVPPPAASKQDHPPIVVILEPGRPRVARELLGHAALLAAEGSRPVNAIVPAKLTNLNALGCWGADHVVLVDRTNAPDDVATAIAGWSIERHPWAILVPSTMWGREVAGRVAARLGAGLTGDATGLDVVGARLVGWKPAFGGQLIAAITATSAVQMVTIRPGVLAIMEPRSGEPPTVETLDAQPSNRVRTIDSGRDDDVDVLATARVVVGVGAGVDHTRYPELEAFVAAMGGTLAATRKVTDREWMPRSRQIGITGRSIHPDLYVAIGISGRFNHIVGVRAARAVLAVNTDPDAPIFAASDIGIVGDWGEVLPLLKDALTRRLAATHSVGSKVD